MPEEALQFPAGLQVPESDRLVKPRGDQAAAICRESERVHFLATLDLFDLLAALQVPQANGPVEGAGNSPLAVRQEGNSMRMACVALQGFQKRTGFEVPEEDALVRVVAAGECPAAVRGKGHARDTGVVSPQFEEFLTTLQVPEPHGLVRAAGECPLAVGGED